MRTVYKYPLKMEDVQRIQIPGGAKFLALHTQHGMPCLWAEVNTERKNVEWVLMTFGTGHEIPKDYGEYLGTYLVRQDALVFHVYLTNIVVQSGSPQKDDK